MFNDEPRSRNGVILFSDDSVCSIMTVASALSLRTYVASVHSTLSCRSIPWSDGMECHWNTSWSLLVRSDRYILWLHPLNEPCETQPFQQYHARPHVAGNIRSFHNTENIPLLIWLAHSADLSQIENVWIMVADRLAWALLSMNCGILLKMHYGLWYLRNSR